MIYRSLLAVTLVGLSASLSPADSIPGRVLAASSQAPAGSDSQRSPAERRSLEESRQAALSAIDAVFPGAARTLSQSGEQSGPVLEEPRTRQEMPKRDLAVTATVDPTTGESNATGRLIVKFRDHLRFRAPRASIDRPVSEVEPAAADQFGVLLAKHGGTIAQWINRTPEQLAALERRALEHSGRSQPDLAGMMVVSFANDVAVPDLEGFAREIQGLDSVEFVWLELKARLHQCGTQEKPSAPVTAPGTPCNTVSLSCEGLPPSPPWDASVTTPVFGCNNQQVPAEEREGWWGCVDNACCELVSNLVANCEDGESGTGWDALCAAYANLICSGTIFDSIPGPGTDPAQRYNPCLTNLDGTATNPLLEPYLNVLSSSCGKPHPGRGCNLPFCCYQVCTADPFCCSNSWDALCVQFANSLPVCSTPTTPQPTPNFLPVQKYLTSVPVANPSASQWQGSIFYGGEGLDLDRILRVQQDLESAYGLGPVLDHGKTINVAVIEFSAFVNHEDFVIRRGPATSAQAQNPAFWDLLDQPKVIPEPNQTILLIPGANNDPEHGTATLSQIVAARQGDPTVAPPIPEVGGHGIAYNAQGYFFPIVSVEEGSRAQNAFISCFEIFGPGDVTNNSWGFGDGNTVASVEPYNLLLRLGSDLGITTVVSAGNSSLPIVPQPIDSGAIVVGASTPGTVLPGSACLANAIGRFGRLPFSNFSNIDATFDKETGIQLGLVHVSAWGSDIFACGEYPGQGFGYQVGANLPFPGPKGNPLETNKLRTYTQGFSGTSGAGPIIAACVALLQATSKQAFGGPLGPEQIRAVVSGYGRVQCETCCSVEPDGGPWPANCCPCNTEPCEVDNPELTLGWELISNTSIGVCMPFLGDAAVGVITGGFPDGNSTEIKVFKGYPVAGPPANIYIRAPDNNYLRLGTEQAQAGSRFEGLAYLVTGPTTDVYAKLSSNIGDPGAMQNLGLLIQGRSTAQLVIVGGFMYNYVSNRWDFIGVGFYGPQDNLITLPVPGYSLQSYYGDGGVFRARVWTCGLGASGPHQVWHDWIQLGVNNPLFVPPGP